MIYTTNSHTYDLDTILVDLNGTLVVGGELQSSTSERIQKLRDIGFRIVLISGDQRGSGRSIAKSLGIEFFEAKTQEEKSQVSKNFPINSTVAIGNSRIDIGMFSHACLRIGILQSEGIHVGILPYIDVLMTHIDHALDMFLDSDIFSATMKQ